MSTILGDTRRLFIYYLIFIYRPEQSTCHKPCCRRWGRRACLSCCSAPRRGSPRRSIPTNFPLKSPPAQVDQVRHGANRRESIAVLLRALMPQYIIRSIVRTLEITLRKILSLILSNVANKLPNSLTQQVKFRTAQHINYNDS